MSILWGAPGDGPHLSILSAMSKAFSETENLKGVFLMPDPRSCNLRKTKPVGPMILRARAILCNDLDCFKKCVEFNRKERGEMAVSDS